MALIFAPSAVAKSKSRTEGIENEHARHYEIVTLNQIPLQKGDVDVALQLVGVYFHSHCSTSACPLITKRTHGKLMSAILMGVNRVLPFAKLNAAEAR